MEKKSHPIDDFFRDALKDHQAAPKEETRTALLARASRMARRRRHRWIWWGGAGAGLVVIILAGGLLLTKQETVPGGKTDISPEIQQFAADSIQGAEGRGQGAEGRAQRAEGKSSSGVRKGVLKTNDILAAESPKQKTEEFQTRSSVAQTPPSENPDTQGQGMAAQQSPSSVIPPVLQGGSHSADSLPPSVSSQRPADSTAQAQALSLQDTLARSSSHGATRPFEPEADDHRLHFSLGASYTAEWMFQTLEGDKYVNNAALEGVFRLGRYSLRLGAGVSLTKGTNEYLVEYNDYLGSYNKLDSMEFSWDVRHYYLLPTYYMTAANVWDSAIETTYPTVEKRYTYLQIPLVLGYDFLQRGRFGLGLRAGPILSILLASKQLTPSYDPGLNQVITTNQISPDRIQMNWQVMGGLCGSIAVTRKVSFELEPEVRYYFNSVYEKSDISTKPWSAGIRAAIMIKF